MNAPLTHSLYFRARVNYRRLDHELAWLTAAVRKARKRDRGALIEREGRRIAMACVRVVVV